MKKIFTLALILIAFLLSNAGAQDNKNEQKQPAQAPPTILKPVFVVEDIHFSLQLLNTIEVQGSEVDAFIQVKDYLQSIVKAVIAQNKANTDLVQVDFPLNLAQSFVNLLQRAKILGVNAERFKRLQNSILDAAKAAAVSNAEEQNGNTKK
ncbi:MAG: hypothetical protein HW421_1028 [Ignavibacteria bacterium]|nr:hypothetical protein [Ignavibacteria bacterium]